MSVAESPFGPWRSRAFRPGRLAILAVTLASVLCLLFVAQHVIDMGYIRRDVAALLAGEEWKTGGWLSQLVLASAGLIPDLTTRQVVLALTAATVMGLMLGVLYGRLRGNGWYVAGALLVIASIGGHALVLYSVSAASRSIPLFIALAAMIPAIRRVEDIGDVQSAIGLGLLMPLLLLAGPSTAPLVLLFAIGAALANPDGRSDPRAFVAMLLVAVLPTIIVAIGIVGFVAQARLDLVNILLPYLPAYASIGLGDWQAAVMRLFVYAPVMVVPLAYCMVPNPPEKRHVGSALAVVLLPLYLALGNSIFPWNLSPHVPAVALLATFASWLAVVRLSLMLRIAAVLLLLATLTASWGQSLYWNDPAWKAALFASAPLQAV